MYVCMYTCMYVNTGACACGYIQVCECVGVLKRVVCGTWRYHRFSIQSFKWDVWDVQSHPISARLDVSDIRFVWLNTEFMISWCPTSLVAVCSRSWLSACIICVLLCYENWGFCICTYAYICMYVCMFVCMFVYIHVCMKIRVRVLVGIYRCVGVWVRWRG